jgi:predicted cobalt transporter CbtA
MKAYRTVLYASLLVTAVGVALPLVTLHSFEGYIQAWLTFLVILAPAYLLVLLLILSRRLSPPSVAIASLVFTGLLAIACVFAKGNIVFLALFFIGASSIVLGAHRNRRAHLRDAAP